MNRAKFDELSQFLIAGLNSACLRTLPWRFLRVNQALPPNVARDMAATFRSASLSHCERGNVSKTYRFATAALTASEGATRLLLSVFSSDAYRAELSRHTGIQLAKAEVRFDLWEYSAGDWLSPHVDKPEKLVTQIVYFTESWHESAHGRLLILEHDDISSVVEAIPPCSGNSAILVRSDDSWHAVEALAEGASPRRSLTITYMSGASSRCDADSRQQRKHDRTDIAAHESAFVSSSK